MRQADTNQVGKHFFQSKKEVKENDVTEMLQKMYTHELQNYNTNSAWENDGISPEDLKFVQVLDNGTNLLIGIMKFHSHYVMIMLDSQIKDYKLRRGLHICREKCQGTINSRITI